MQVVDKCNLDLVFSMFRDNPDELRYMARQLGYQTRSVQRGNLHLIPTIVKRVYAIWGLRVGLNSRGDQMVGLSSQVITEGAEWECIIMFRPEENPPKNSSRVRRSWVWYDPENVRSDACQTREECLDDIWQDYGLIPGEGPPWNVEQPGGWEDDPIDEDEEYNDGTGEFDDEDYDYQYSHHQY